jgi:flagellar motor component MotA
MDTIRPNATEDGTTNGLNWLHISNMGSIEEMFSKVGNNQYLAIAFYPSGLVRIGVKEKGKSMDCSESLVSVFITKEQDLEARINEAIENRTYRTVKQLNEAIQETKEYERKLKQIIKMSCVESYYIINLQKHKKVLTEIDEMEKYANENNTTIHFICDSVMLAFDTGHGKKQIKEPKIKPIALYMTNTL